MYLARTESAPNRYEFILRESYEQGEIFVSRDIVHLGRDPEAFLVYEGGNSFYIDEVLLKRLRDQGIQTPYSELEDIFFPYVDQAIRSKLEPFRDRYKHRNWKKADEAQRQRAMLETHCFDRARLHFLRLGRSSVQAIEKTPALYVPLLDKSRDEREQLILMQEQRLSAREYQYYLFSIFNLQRHFQESYARSMPQALDREKVDTFFLEEFCALEADEFFWRGFRRDSCLPQYILRYLFMYFDYGIAESFSWQPFNEGRRQWRQHARSASASVGTGSMTRVEALRIFDLQKEQLMELDRKTLSRLYRKKAQELHPDKGGDPEHFILLTVAYEMLLPSLR